MVHKSMIQSKDEENKYHLYNNTVELDFDDVKHSYSINGEKIIGTTSVLNVLNKPAIVPWAVKITVAHFESCLRPGVSYDEIQIKNMLEDAKMAHKRRSSNAMDVGTAVHDWIKNHIAGNKPPMPVNQLMQNAIGAFLKWEKDHKVKFLESERLLYSKKHNYAGTLDFIAQVDGKIKIGDFKTSTGIYDEYWFQVAAYLQAYLEEFPSQEVVGGIIVRIGKDGALEIGERKDKDGKILENGDYIADVKKNAAVFNAALTIYRRQNELKAEHPWVPWKK